MKTTSHHVQFQPGGAFYPVAQCTFTPSYSTEGEFFNTPAICVSMSGVIAPPEKLGSVHSTNTEAKAEAERLIEEALASVVPERVALNREDSTRFAEALLKAGPFPKPLPAPALRMTPDGHVTQFGAITAPDGCYLLAAGEGIHRADKSLENSKWRTVDSMEWGNEVNAILQYTYARNLPEKGGA